MSDHRIDKLMQELNSVVDEWRRYTAEMELATMHLAAARVKLRSIRELVPPSACECECMCVTDGVPHDPYTRKFCRDERRCLACRIREALR